ncbi:putative enzyme [uncultured Eubacteriales bacterium]|uniref:Putative enzyme n=1 Tax=uncultured Eubacteriales bacterium TaxID=172733 RepID=A0A212IUY1_9FIRM|nr:putative enzyme [uncultured Eubacteriales bacterium]
MRYYVVDAFTDKLFGGNPAGVCLLDEWPDKEEMQSIAAENNLAETAFVVKREGYYDLRWFTPEVEIDLCGHATLASGFIIANFVDPKALTMRFETQSGTLTVTKHGDIFELDFPTRLPKKIEVTQLMSQAISTPVLEAHLSRDLLLLVDSEKDVKDLTPDLNQLKQIPDCFAVIVTAKGETADFVSRFFAPNAGITEDPVTGSSHSTLIPFWAERLRKSKLTAKQLSKRGGVLYCENCGDRVKIAGKAVLYLQGEISK